MEFRWNKVENMLPGVCKMCLVTVKHDIRTDDPDVQKKYKPSNSIAIGFLDNDLQWLVMPLNFGRPKVNNNDFQELGSDKVIAWAFFPRAFTEGTVYNYGEDARKSFSYEQPTRGRDYYYKDPTKRGNW